MSFRVIESTVIVLEWIVKYAPAFFNNYSIVGGNEKDDHSVDGGSLNHNSQKLFGSNEIASGKKVNSLLHFKRVGKQM